MTAMKVR